MSIITKSDLQTNRYNWREYDPNDPKVSGAPNHTVFDRREGYEVLFLINSFGRFSGFKWAPPKKKFEQMVYEHLPEDVCTQQEAVDWIIHNWSKY